ncbi:hypothetical protein BDU57DRAFT_144367 [Ampelomyces quisqualis]|uniref:Uncharacterized protein n=1 Tax=Ampelomyces quisqualis TaxID=50730 RepID=A0A6A5QYA7_AMPQU|nr:hypothetical protein BDU57DRAFT_144367 [Ampelomyces quisqualis]
MAKKMGYYNVEDFTRQKKQQEKEIVVPPRANFLAAAKHLRSLFDGKKFTYAFMGSLEMLCLGCRREMPDLQIAYDDRDFNRIKAKLEVDQRVRLPEGINSLFPAKILVRTGPAYKDENCTQAGDIEVDLIPPGCHGTPSNGSLARNVVLLSLKVEGKLRTYKGLNLTYLVKTLMQYCRVSDLAWDPRKDILFLCQEYGEEVSSIRSQLDQEAMQQSFSAALFLSRLSPDEQRKCYQVLLGTEPPPIMAITPPALPPTHQHSASTSDALAKSRAASCVAPCPLKSQTPPSLLTPSIPGKPIASRRVSSNHAVTAPKISDLSTARESPPMNMNAATKNSRSRYRQITSPRIGDVGPLDAQYPVNIRHSSQQPNSLHQSACHGSQLSPNHVSIPALQNSASMPYLNVRQPVPVLHHRFAQTALLNGPGQLPQRPHNHVSPIEMSESPVTKNSCQHDVKLPQGLGGGEIPSQHQDSHIPIVNRSILALTRDVQQQQQPQTNQLHAINHDEPANSQEKPDPTDASQFPTLPLELDVVSELGHFIAAMSVDRRTPAPVADYESMIPPPLHPHVQPSPVMPTRPLNPRTSSAPLPASLLPGGSTTHDRRTRLLPPPISSSSSPPRINVARYTRYYAPPPSTPGSPQPAYKAYQPSFPLILPLSPPVVQEDMTPDTATPDRESRFSRLGDVDGKEEHVKRVSRSIDSRLLAQDYIASLPCFEHGYGAATC